MDNTTKINTTNRTSCLHKLISELNCKKYGRYLIVISEHPKIATDELSQFIKSNNHHNASQHLNEVIIPLGWVIVKFPVENPSKSWRWHLMPVSKALRLGIDKRLRRKIYRLLEAANDE